MFVSVIALCKSIQSENKALFWIRQREFWQIYQKLSDNQTITTNLITSKTFLFKKASDCLNPPNIVHEVWNHLITIIFTFYIIAIGVTLCYFVQFTITGTKSRKAFEIVFDIVILLYHVHMWGRVREEGGGRVGKGKKGEGTGLHVHVVANFNFFSEIHLHHQPIAGVSVLQVFSMN